MPRSNANCLRIETMRSSKSPDSLFSTILMSPYPTSSSIKSSGKKFSIFSYPSSFYLYCYKYREKIDKFFFKDVYISDDMMRLLKRNITFFSHTLKGIGWFVKVLFLTVLLAARVVDSDCGTSAGNLPVCRIHVVFCCFYVFPTI